MVERKSKYRGVYWNKRRNKWMARINGADGKSHYLGYFRDEMKAFEAYCKKFKALYGRSFQHIEAIIDKETNTVKIPLNKTKSFVNHGYWWAIIDLDDYDKVKDYPMWMNSRSGYVTLGINRKRCKLHNVIMKVKNIDHRDGNKLDNRKSNLRGCTHAQNMCNMTKHRGNHSSPHKGVTWHKQRNKWYAQIGFNYKKIYIGLFNSEENAAQAYNFMAEKLHGEFARYNIAQ